MTYEELMIKLRQDQYAPVIVLSGEEPYYIDAVSDYIEQNALDAASQAFDQVVLYGRDLPSADIAYAISQARGFSMMGGRKVVIVKEAQAVKRWDALGLYLSNPQATSVLVIACKGKLDGRIALWKDVEKKGGVMLKSEKLRDDKVAAWITSYIAKRNEELRAQGDEISIDPRVAELLAASIGADLNSIVGAIQKLIDGRPAGTHVIDAALVERNVGISKDYNVFELQKALITGDVVSANRITQYFATSKDHPMVKELGMLYTFFANLMLYHYIPNKANDRMVASILGVNPYFVRDYAAAARRYNAMKTMRIIGYFRETDARSKGMNNNTAKDGDLWKELIYKILH